MVTSVALQVLPNFFGGGGDTISQVISMLFYVVFIVFIFYGQRIQMYVMIREVEGSLFKLKYIKEEGRKITIETIKEIGKPQTTNTTKTNNPKK